MGMFDKPEVVKEIDGKEIAVIRVGEEYGSTYYGKATVVRKCRKRGNFCSLCGRPIEKGQYYIRHYSIDWFEKFVDYEKLYHLECVEFDRWTRIYDRKGNLIYEFVPMISINSSREVSSE